jgi:DNA-binding response OmpR family regulator
VSKHVLIVDDDTLLRRSLAFNLERAGFRASTAASAEDALAYIRRDVPDLILLDIGLPGMDGLDVLRTIRQQYPQTPTILLTARRRELEQVLGLELGADDYVTKPFDIDVLLARIKAVLRRTQATTDSAAPNDAQPLVAGDLTIDSARHQVQVGSKTLSLPPREFDLLHALALEAGRVLSVDELLSRVWGPEYEGEPQVVYVHIRWLREKIESDPANPRRIISLRGVGYKLEPQVA